MTTKYQPNTRKEVEEYTYSYSNASQSYTTRNPVYYYTGSNVISYQEGKQLPSGRWPWKECDHVSSNLYTPVYGNVTWAYARRMGTPIFERESGSYNWIYPDWDRPPAAPEAPLDTSVFSKLMEQLDLNSRENVLLYSGVLQAVPLLGSVFKFNRILKDAARKFGKDLRKKPFTTAVKSLISADFIDRFVISPTIDDARRFMDATNYVLRVIETARERNAHQFALQSASTDVREHSEEQSYSSVNGDSGEINYLRVSDRRIETKAFMLLEAEYDMMAVDPLKIWAQRVGLTRPLDSVWDLVPFSFVIDYFTRAGDFISALSDEMSNVDGLNGRITKIHDLWYTQTRRSTRYRQGLSLRRPPSMAGGTWEMYPRFTAGKGGISNVVFTRRRVKNPWAYLLSLQRQEDYLSINLSLSSTRKRTIAELFIQAKL